MNGKPFMSMIKVETSTLTTPQLARIFICSQFPVLGSEGTGKLVPEGHMVLGSVSRKFGNEVNEPREFTTGPFLFTTTCKAAHLPMVAFKFLTVKLCLQITIVSFVCR